MACAESLKVQAYFDGELEGTQARAIEQHLESCTECRALLTDLKRLQTLIRRDLSPRLPAALTERIRAALDSEPARATVHVLRPTAARRPFWLGALGGLTVGALAASLLFSLLPLIGGSLAEELAAAHVRSLGSAHLIEVESSDHHTVKPWFAGHADVSPVVADFAAQGFRLAGGRTDLLGHQRAAVLVYQHGAHLINVFAWEDRRGGRAGRETRSGYHMIFWQDRDLAYCAVSDTGWNELEELVALLRVQQAADAPH